MRDPVDHLPSANMVQDDRSSCFVCYGIRYFNELGRVPHKRRCVAAMNGQCRDALADASSRDTLAEGFHRPSGLVARHDRGRWREAIATGKHHEVGGPDAGCAHANAHLTSPWRLGRVFGDSQVSGCARRRNLQGEVSIHGASFG